MFITKENQEEYKISGDSETSNECGNQEMPEIEAERDEKIKMQTTTHLYENF